MAHAADADDLDGQSIEQGLREISELRSTDSRKYWSDDVQARELALYEAREKLQGQQHAPAKESKTKDSSVGSPKATNASENLAHVEDGDGLTAAESAEIDAELEAEDQRLIDRGIFTREELDRLRRGERLSDAPAKPKPPSRQEVAQELAEIRKLRTIDSRKYWSDDVQARELELLALQEKLKGGPPEKEKGEPSEQVDPATWLDHELVEEWQGQGGVEAHLEIAQKTARLALDDLEDEDRTDLAQGFDGLPAGAQREVIRFLAVDGASWPAASDEAVQTFASTAEGAELVEEWGRDAAKNVSVVRNRLALMVRGMTPEDQSAAMAWFDDLPPAQAKAMFKALVGKR